MGAGKSCWILLYMLFVIIFSVQLRHNKRDGVSNHQPHDCLFNRLFKAQIKENIKAPRHWPLCRNSPVTGEFPAQCASNAENVSIWCRHHVSAGLCASHDLIIDQSCMYQLNSTVISGVHRTNSEIHERIHHSEICILLLKYRKRYISLHIHWYHWYHLTKTYTIS